MPDMPAEVARYNSERQNHGLEKALDNRLIELAQPALRTPGEGGDRHADPQRQPHVGTMLSHEIARRYGHDGLPDGTIHIRFAGQRGRASVRSSRAA